MIPNGTVGRFLSVEKLMRKNKSRRKPADSVNSWLAENFFYKSFAQKPFIKGERMYFFFFWKKKYQKEANKRAA